VTRSGIPTSAAKWTPWRRILPWSCSSKGANFMYERMSAKVVLDSAAVVDLFNFCHPSLPADIGWLGVLGRQMILDVQADEWTAGADTLAHTRAVWVRLKGSALAQGGGNVAAQYEASLETLSAALAAENTDEWLSEAAGNLEIVRALQILY
jgi:hypothetical protein